MVLRWLKRRDEDGNRWQLWPVRLSFVTHFGARAWFRVHGWQTGSELTMDGTNARGCVPGIRLVFGQTFHLGPLKILFGREQSDEQRELVAAWCRYQEVVSRVLRGQSDDKDAMRRHWDLMSELGRLQSMNRELRREQARGLN